MTAGQALSPGRFVATCGDVSRQAMRCDVWRWLALALALMACSSGALAEGDTADAETRIKAAFLFKFLGFVDWPQPMADHADTPFVIGVLGQKRLADELVQIASGHQVGGHPVRVRVLGRDDAPAGLQLLFVAGGESGRLAALTAAADGQPMLVVAEAPSGLAPGVAINFVVVDDKVRFDVSLRPAERVGLKISSRLLAVARSVVPGAP